MSSSSIRNSIGARSFRAIVPVALLFCAFAPAVIAQQIVDSPRPLRVTPDTTVNRVILPALLPGTGSEVSQSTTSDSPSLSIAPEHGASISLGDHCSPDYWIVSSRTCEQKRKKCDWGCCFDFFRYRDSESQLRPGDAAEFESSLNPAYPVCVVIHGSFVGWDDVCKDSFYTYRWLRAACPDQPLQVVFFSWPSDTSVFPIPHLTIAKLGRQAEYNGFHLATLISHFPVSQPVTILGHSHGSRTAVSAMHLLGGGGIQNRFVTDCDPSRRYHVVFAAAAMDHHWLNPGQRYDRALCRIECLVNLINRRDIALAFYPLRAPFARRAVAVSGFTDTDWAKLGYTGSQVSEIDVTSLVGPHHMWPHYYNHPEIATAIHPVLHFDDSSAGGSTDDSHPDPAGLQLPVPEVTPTTAKPRSQRSYSVFRAPR
ncbi:MAG: hypothetical protein ACKVT0_10335 [Planctomycetaceae bacterium]